MWICGYAEGTREKGKKGAKEGYVLFLWNDGDAIRYTMMTDSNNSKGRRQGFSSKRAKVERF
jgi:hypothetical protein